jgi:hypothetical protein
MSPCHASDVKNWHRHDSSFQIEPGCPLPSVLARTHAKSTAVTLLWLTVWWTKFRFGWKGGHATNIFSAPSQTRNGPAVGRPLRPVSRTRHASASNETARHYGRVFLSPSAFVRVDHPAPHSSLDGMTPDQAYFTLGSIARQRLTYRRGKSVQTTGPPLSPRHDAGCERRVHAPSNGTAESATGCAHKRGRQIKKKATHAL